MTVMGSERPDFPPVWRMIRKASTSRMTSKHPRWGRTSSKVHSLFQQPTTHPSIHQSTDRTKKEKRKARHPTCVLDDEKGINMGKTIIRSAFYIHSSSKPNIHPSIHPLTAQRNQRTDFPHVCPMIRGLSASWRMSRHPH